MSQDILTPQTLRKLLKYNPKTGELFWRERTPNMFKDGEHTAEHRCNNWNSCFAVKAALIEITDNHYRYGHIFNLKYRAHRVIWAMQTGEWPAAEIDHKNHIRDDNRWENLREATRLENCRNQTLRKDNTSGTIGVTWMKKIKKWRAQIVVNGRNIFLGEYADKEDAISARKEAEKRFGFHPNHGKVGA